MCFSAHVYWMYFIADRFSKSLSVTLVHCYTLSLSVFLHARIVMDGSANGVYFSALTLTCSENNYLFLSVSNALVSVGRSLPPD